MSFIGRKAPGAAGGEAAAAVGVAEEGAVAGAVDAAGGVCACDVLKARKLVHAMLMNVSLKQGFFIAIKAS